MKKLVTEAENSCEMHKKQMVFKGLKKQLSFIDSVKKPPITIMKSKQVVKKPEKSSIDKI